MYVINWKYLKLTIRYTQIDKCKFCLLLQKKPSISTYAMTSHVPLILIQWCLLNRNCYLNRCVDFSKWRKRKQPKTEKI